MPGCKSAREHRQEADEAAYKLIEQKQKEALGKDEPFTIETAEDTLRRRLLIKQNLPYSHEASLGAHALEPIPHWPSDNYLRDAKPTDPGTPLVDVTPLQVDLLSALKIAARNSREYQTQKERVFVTALRLDLERDEFRGQFDAAIAADGLVVQSDSDNPDSDRTGVGLTPSVGVTQRFKNGMSITTRLALNLVKLLTDPEEAALGIISDTSLTIPLMRGSGAHIVTEPLTQAERDVAYALLEFEQFKKQFVVNVATQYFAVLQQYDRADNAEDNYRSLILSAQRSRALTEAGRLAAIQLDQAVQAELRAREQWISAQQGLQRSVDSFKLLLGLPPDALLEFDRSDLSRLETAAQPVLEAARVAAGPSVQVSPTTRPSADVLPTPNLSQPGIARGSETQPATRAATQRTAEEVELVPPSLEGAGPMEIPEQRALLIAFENRPDLRVAQGQVFDAQRQVVVAGDALRPGLNFDANAGFGEGRSIGGLNRDTQDARLRFDRGTYNAGLLLDLPLERTAERNAYRVSLINLEAATRELQDFEDGIKADVRDDLRELLQQRESLINQAKQVQVADRRVKSSQAFFDAGRAEIRDVLEAQDAFVSAQNSFTSALIGYRIAELELQRDLGVLEVNHEGIWQEFDPAEAMAKRLDAETNGAPAAVRPDEAGLPATAVGTAVTGTSPNDAAAQ